MFDLESVIVFVHQLLVGSCPRLPAVTVVLSASQPVHRCMAMGEKSSFLLCIPAQLFLAQLAPGIDESPVSVAVELAAWCLWVSVVQVLLQSG